MTYTVSQLTFKPVGAHLVQASLAAAVLVKPNPGQDNVTQVIIQAFGANVRYTMDGSPPTAVFGFQLQAGDVERVIPLDRNVGLRVIQESAGASVQYQFGGY